MSIYDSITLIGIMGALAAIPSASVALVVARSATRGVASGLAVAGGIVLGDLVFIALALLGLSVVAEGMGSLFVIVKIIGGLYLIWLGYSLFSKGDATEINSNITNNSRSLATSFMAGFILTLGDIKAIIFYASLLPVFVDLSAIQSSDILTLIIVTIFSVGGVKSIYAICSHKVAGYAQNINMEAAVRKVAGGLMVGAGSYLIVKA